MFRPSNSLCYWIIGIGVVIRLLLLTSVSYHDDIYMSWLYLHDSPLSPGSTGFSWGHDWQRQLTIHPQALLGVYWVWIRVFGDSELSLHILPFLAWFNGTIVWNSIFARFLNSFERGIALLFLCLSPASIIYSVQAIYVPFEWFTSGLLVLAFLDCFRRDGLIRYVGFCMTAVATSYLSLFAVGVSSIFLAGIISTRREKIVFLLLGIATLFSLIYLFQLHQAPWRYWQRADISTAIIWMVRLPISCNVWQIQ